MNNLSHETAVEYLISAPKVVRELQTMHWMFLDGPPDGTVMLVWQPLNHLGTNFASDGYVWADAEQIYSTEIRGYVRLCKFNTPMSRWFLLMHSFSYRIWSCIFSAVDTIPPTNRLLHIAERGTALRQPKTRMRTFFPVTHLYG